MRVIFLDFDGVINKRTGGEPEVTPIVEPGCIENLNRVIRATDARIVLITAWRHMANDGFLSVPGFGWMMHTWGMEANGRVIGAVPMETAGMDRGGAVRVWLNGFAVCDRYVVIDDLDLGHTKEGHPFVQTDSHRGFTTEDAKKSYYLLMGKPLCE